jgi:hypothetical protein
MEMKLIKMLRSMAAACALVTVNAAAQQGASSIVSSTYQYADLADLALAAPITAHVKIKSAKRLSKELSTGVGPGLARHLITADVIALIKATEGVPKRIQYLVDLPVDSRGKVQKLTKSESLIFAIPAGPAFVRLVAPDAQVPWSAEAARSVRAILSEAARADAPPVVRGISSAFHSEGSIPGEGETQIFLNSPEDKPVSLTVQRRTGEQPRWFVSQGEVVDEGTSQPRPDTLLWYRIACTLPVSIPPSSVDGQPADAIANIKADYKVILEGLGPCNRTRKAAGGR